MYWTVVVCVVMGVVAAQIVPPWWQSAVYYRVVVDSFKDTDGDGLGDLKGLTKQMSYIRAIGADAAILSPLGARSTDCSKPGTLDFIEIDTRYGSNDEFNGVLEKAKKIGLKIIVSLPIQTVSSQSEWLKSSADRVPGYEDRIVWKDGTGDDIPPVYQSLMKLRKETTLSHGEYDIRALSDSTFYLVRYLRTFDTFVLVFNVGERPDTINLERVPHLTLPATVYVSSIHSTRNAGTEIEANQLTLQAGEALILRATPV